MAITFESNGRPAYMFQQGATSTDGVWYPIAAVIDTSASYEFTGVQTFLNDVTFDDAVFLRDGFNNFLNPAARDAAITSAVRGTICFVRQDDGGAALNQIQYYDGSTWQAGGDITAVTSGTGISLTNPAGPIPTIAIDTTTVPTLTSSSTLTNKTIALGSNTVSGTIAEFNTAVTDADFATLAGSETLTNKTLTAPIVTYSVNTVTTSAYVVVASDAAAIVTMNNASANTFKIPTNASVGYAVGSTITVIQIGAGQTTISAVTSGTTTIASTGATATAPALRAQYSSATCIKVATDTWYVVGDVT